MSLNRDSFSSERGRDLTGNDKYYLLALISREHFISLRTGNEAKSSGNYGTLLNLTNLEVNDPSISRINTLRFTKPFHLLKGVSLCIILFKI